MEALIECQGKLAHKGDTTGQPKEDSGSKYQDRGLTERLDDHIYGFKYVYIHRFYCVNYTAYVKLRQRGLVVTPDNWLLLGFFEHDVTVTTFTDRFA
jgi:hypothetical protein